MSTLTRKPTGIFRHMAAVLAAITATIHFIVGGTDALAPTLEASLPAEATGAMHACWHFVTVFLIASVLVFWKGGQTAHVFGALWILFASVFIYVGFFHDGIGGLLTNPQWTILGVTGILMAIDAYVARPDQ